MLSENAATGVATVTTHRADFARTARLSAAVGGVAQDIPLIDGPCEAEPDHSCSDPANVDEGGHGTHMAGTIGAPLNGIGIGGVAPNVSLVNLRAGQDSGYFFLQPTIDALTFAGDHGIDVVNMSPRTSSWPRSQRRWPRPRASSSPDGSSNDPFVVPDCSSGTCSPARPAA